MRWAECVFGGGELLTGSTAGAASCRQLGLTEPVACILTRGGVAAPSLDGEKGHHLDDSLGQSGLLLDK